VRPFIAPIASVLIGIACGLLAVPGLNEHIYGERSVVPLKHYSGYPPGMAWPPVNPYAHDPPATWVFWCSIRTLPSLLPSAIAIVLIAILHRRASLGHVVALGLLLSITQAIAMAGLLIYDQKIASYAPLPRQSVPAILVTAPLGAVWACAAWLTARALRWRGRMRSLILPITLLASAALCGWFVTPRLNEAIYGERTAVAYELYESGGPPPGWTGMWSGDSFARRPPWHWVLWCALRSLPALLPSAVVVAIGVVMARPSSLAQATTLGLLVTVAQALILAAMTLYTVTLTLPPIVPNYSLPVIFATAPLGAVWAGITWCLIPSRWRRGQPGRLRCVTCGYNLTGNVSGVCPECGRPVEKEHIENARRPHGD
jgi:hypothetical protein